jgi:hypothetical protein
MNKEYYLNKVLDFLIGDTIIDIDKQIIYSPFNVNINFTVYEYLPQKDINKFNGYVGRPLNLSEWVDRFFNYIISQFGLTLEEMEYVYENYITYIDTKIGYI